MMSTDSAMKLPQLYPILDTGTLVRRGMDAVAAAGAMIEGGAEILQLRHKGRFTRGDFATAERVAGLCRDAGVPFIVDDRADVARLVGAGLHLGQDDLPPSLARKVMGPDAVIGFSTHNAEQLQEAEHEPVDYVAVGPVFGTATKENPDPVLGVDGLRELCGLTRRPLVAIGGITRENAWNVLRAGADSLAVIGDLMPEELTPASLRKRMEEWRMLLSGT